MMGVVLVGFGPQDSGKSIAAEFLLHGPQLPSHSWFEDFRSWNG